MSSNTLLDCHNSTIGEVKRLSNDEYRVVDIGNISCSCNLREEMQFPCEHGYAAIMELKKNVVEFVNSVFHMNICLKVVERLSTQ